MTNLSIREPKNVILGKEQTYFNRTPDNLGVKRTVVEGRLKGDANNRYYLESQINYDVDGRKTTEVEKSLSLEHRIYDGNPKNSSYLSKKQTLSYGDEGDMLVSEVKRVKGYDNVGKTFKSIEYMDRNGNVNVTRMVDGEIVGGYEFGPVQRKLMTGFKGKVEALAMKIGTNSTGCERPVLRRVSGFMLDMLRKIK